MKALAREDGFRLVFAMDGVREAVYSGKPPESYEVHKLNVIARDLTAELDLPFLDLQTTFADSYRRDVRRFEFPFDWHWNALGNELAGKAITKELLADRRLLGARPPPAPPHPCPRARAAPIASVRPRACSPHRSAEDASVDDEQRRGDDERAGDLIGRQAARRARSAPSVVAERGSAASPA